MIPWPTDPSGDVYEYPFDWVNIDSDEDIFPEITD